MENYEKTEENLQKAQEKLQQAELRYAQAEHQYKLEQNRQNYCKKRSQKERTHRLITRGVAVEMQHEGLDELTEGEFYDFIEAVFMQSNSLVLYIFKTKYKTLQPQIKSASRATERVLYDFREFFFLSVK